MDCVVWAVWKVIDDVKVQLMYGSASLDIDVFHVCDHADAGPALGFHLVEVFQAGQVGSCV